MKREKNCPWVEKYRPTNIADVRDQASVTSFFKESFEKKQALHLLLYGPPGTGKTSTILAFCDKLYAGRCWEDYVLEINASYDRGMQSIKDKIKNFCKKAIVPFECDARSFSGDGEDKLAVASPYIVDYKFVILDEADSLSTETQNSLRRCIELYSQTTRFCFLCNYVNRIFSSIVSRCFLSHFHPIGKDTCIKQMMHICDEESVKYEIPALEKLYSLHRGDLRSCISSLQAMHYLYIVIKEEHIADFATNIDACTIQTFVDQWDKKRDENEARAQTGSTQQNELLIRLADELYNQGQSPLHLLRSLTQWSLANANEEFNYQFAAKTSYLERHCSVVRNTKLVLCDILFAFFSIKLKPNLIDQCVRRDRAIFTDV